MLLSNVMKIKLIIIGISFFILWGCNAKLSTIKDSACKISLSDMKPFLTDTAFFKSSLVVPLETTDFSFIRDITRVCIAEDILFILDSSLGKVIIFDFEGHYIGRIHALGNGPREYIHISDICIAPNRKCIALLCDQPYKIMYYTYSGEFVEEASYAEYYSEFSICGDSTYCYDLGNEGERKLQVYKYPMTKEREMSFFEGDSFDADGKGITYSFSRGKRMTASDDIMFTWSFDFSIYSLDEGRAYQKYVIDFKEHQLPRNLLKNNLSPIDFMNLCDENNYVSTVENVVENSNYLLFGTNKYMFVYYKYIDKLVGYNFILNSSLKAGKVDYLPMNSSNYIAQAWRASEFKRFIDNIREHDGNLENVNGKYIKIYESVGEEDNPILIIYELPYKSLE